MRASLIDTPTVSAGAKETRPNDCVSFCEMIGHFPSQKIGASPSFSAENKDIITFGHKSIFLIHDQNN